MTNFTKIILVGSLLIANTVVYAQHVEPGDSTRWWLHYEQRDTILVDELFYDADGNLIEKVHPILKYDSDKNLYGDTETEKYFYNEKKQLIKKITREALHFDREKTAEFFYDENGALIEKKLQWIVDGQLHIRTSKYAEDLRVTESEELIYNKAGVLTQRIYIENYYDPMPVNRQGIEQRVTENFDQSGNVISSLTERDNIGCPCGDCSRIKCKVKLEQILQ